MFYGYTIRLLIFVHVFTRLLCSSCFYDSCSFSTWALASICFEWEPSKRRRQLCFNIFTVSELRKLDGSRLMLLVQQEIKLIMTAIIELRSTLYASTQHLQSVYQASPSAHPPETGGMIATTSPAFNIALPLSWSGTISSFTLHALIARTLASFVSGYREIST